MDVVFLLKTQSANVYDWIQLKECLSFRRIQHCNFVRRTIKSLKLESTCTIMSLSYWCETKLFCPVQKGISQQRRSGVLYVNKETQIPGLPSDTSITSPATQCVPVVSKCLPFVRFRITELAGKNFARLFSFASSSDMMIIIIGMWWLYRIPAVFNLVDVLNIVKSVTKCCKPREKFL